MGNDTVGDDIDGDIRVGLSQGDRAGYDSFGGGFGGGWSDGGGVNSFGDGFGGISSSFARKWTVGGVGGDKFTFGNSNYCKSGSLGDWLALLSGARGDCDHSSANFSLGGWSLNRSLGYGGGSLNGSLGGGFGERTYCSNHRLLTVDCGGVDRRSSWLGRGVT